MNNVNVLLFSISAIAFSFAILEVISLIKNRNKTSKITAQIIDIEFALPESEKIRNCKVATLAYSIDNKNYISKNKIVIPTYKEMGDSVDVKYFIENPNLIYTRTSNKFFIAGFVGILSLVVGLISH